MNINTPETPNPTPQQAIEIVRQHRNQLLADSDWTQIADNGLSDSDRQAWAAYRQQLRDFPATWEPSDTANFPDPPT